VCKHGGSSHTHDAYSDDLAKIDFSIEGLTKRIERQYQVGSKPPPKLLVLGEMVRSLTGAGAAGGTTRQELEEKKNAQDLKVMGQSVDRYIPNFHWDLARYPVRRTLPELVRPAPHRHGHDHACWGGGA
jgi:hypothetical protein